MTDHLTMEQLLAVREPGVEPGVASARAHLEACPACRAELDRLDQRLARLRALPALRPARDQWPAVAGRVRAAQRRRDRRRVVAFGGLALAASLAAALVVGRPAATDPGIDTVAAVGAADSAPAGDDLAAIQARSRELERLLREYGPDARVVDGRTASIAADLEDRIAGVDRALEAAQLLAPERRPVVERGLWRQRVGLMDALVDVHLTGATAVGM